MRALLLLGGLTLVGCYHSAPLDVMATQPRTAAFSQPRSCQIQVAPVVDLRPTHEKTPSKRRQTRTQYVLPLVIWNQWAVAGPVYARGDLYASDLTADLQRLTAATLEGSRICDGRGEPFTVEPTLHHFYGVSYEEDFAAATIGAFMNSAQSFFPAGHVALTLRVKNASGRVVDSAEISESYLFNEADTRVSADHTASGIFLHDDTLQASHIALERLLLRLPHTVDRMLADLPGVGGAGQAGETFVVTRLTREYDFVEELELERASGRIIRNELKRRETPVFSAPDEWVVAPIGADGHWMSTADYRRLIEELSSTYAVTVEANATAARFAGQRRSVVAAPRALPEPEPAAPVVVLAPVVTSPPEAEPPAPTAGEARMVFQVTPPDASVYVDGSPVEALELALAPGVYEVRVERAGYQASTQTVGLTEGQVLQHQVVLSASAGTLLVQSSPSEARFVIRGATTREGQTPANLTDLPIGEYTVEFEPPDAGYAPMTKRVQVEEGTSGATFVTFDRLQTTWSIGSSPEGAHVSLRGLTGEYSGQTPWSELQLDAGVYDVRIDKPGYDTWTMRAELFDRAPAPVFAELRPSADYRDFVKTYADEQRRLSRKKKRPGWVLLGAGATSGVLAGASLLAAHVSYDRYQSTADPDVIANSFAMARAGSYGAIGLGVGAGVLTLPGIVIVSKKSRQDALDPYGAYLKSTGQE